MSILSAPRNIIIKALAGANWVTTAVLLLVGFSYHINPHSMPLLSTIGLAFPVILAIEVAFIAVWTFVDWRHLWIPVLSLVLAYKPVQTYSPIQRLDEAPVDAIKIISYNILGFNATKVADGEKNPIAAYIKDSGADIVCLQEYAHPSKCYDDINEMLAAYPYVDTLRTPHQTGCVALLSKYRILGKQKLPIESAGNLVGIFTIDYHGEPVIVINTHLETVGFSPDDKKSFQQIIKGKSEKDEAKNESKMLIRKLATSNTKRAPQAEAVARFIDEHPGRSIILCGDFNDHPLSYVHHTIAQRLRDCYSDAGRGPGYTFCYNSMYVRIDNIMCSDDWQPYQCHVDRSVSLSDHFPITCKMKRLSK